MDKHSYMYCLDYVYKDTRSWKYLGVNVEVRGKTGNVRSDGNIESVSITSRVLAWLGLAHPRFRPKAKKINNDGDIKKLTQRQLPNPREDKLCDAKV